MIYRVLCSSLKDKVPFVFRRELSSGIYSEKLIQGDKMLYEMQIQDVPGRQHQNYSLELVGDYDKN